ncbi:hypothetical protein [Tepidiforma sp.]|uniref:hypothetical protein n=1 Tax=Tepidiforma sp. TaxID=2682230 RepID=UPI002ADE27BE|nr:hypothetical protein [Tepidiforma sp.]
MPFADPETIAAYREAWDAWQKQLQHLHRVMLDGEPIRPDQLKGLLGREARAKERWEAARRRLLGLESPLDAPPESPDRNPFR